MKWIIKATIQKFLSLIPFGFKINQIIKHIRGTEEEPADYYTTFYRLMILEDLIKHFGSDFKSKKILELGSGWSVEMPALAYVYGFNNYCMSDISFLIRDRSIKAKLSTLINAINKASKIYSNEYPFKIFHDNMMLKKLEEVSKIETFSQFLNKTKYKYLYPIGINSIKSSYDAIISINTLEHIPPIIIRKGFLQILNSLNDNGISIHIIDHNDHFQYIDSSITRLNMHKFSKLSWALLTSRFNYTNRLMIEEYNEILHMENINGYLVPLQYYDNNLIEEFLTRYPHINKNLKVSLSKLVIRKSDNINLDAK